MLACVVLSPLLQDELGEQAVTVLVSFDPNEQGGHVHFEAFQCSDQCVTLTREGWLQDEGEEPSGVTKMQNPQHKDVREAVIVAGGWRGVVCWWHAPHVSAVCTHVCCKRKVWYAARGVVAAADGIAET